MDIRKLLTKGQAAQNAVHAAKEVTKRGNLRGGSTGCVGTDGKIYGECHRVALARSLGVDKAVDDERHIMFDAGMRAEDSWADKLAAAGAVFKREEEIPVVMEIGGKKVTGRPDIVLGHYDDATFVADYGLELKGIYSASSAVRVAYEGIPDPKHLAQAGFYSLALGVDYSICYTNPSVIEVPYWAQKKFGAAKKIQPFYRIFSMTWKDDTLLYKDEDTTDWIETVYTKQGIKDFFALVGELESTKTLGPRPEGGYATGTKLPYDKCQYCPFSKSCDNHEDNYDAWLADLAT